MDCLKDLEVLGLEDLDETQQEVVKGGGVVDYTEQAAAAMEADFAASLAASERIRRVKDKSDMFLPFLPKAALPVAAHVAERGDSIIG